MTAENRTVHLALYLSLSGRLLVFALLLMLRNTTGQVVAMDGIFVFDGGG